MDNTFKQFTVNDLYELAMTAGITDPVDFGEVLIREEDIYRLMSEHIYDMFNDDSDSKITMMAVIVNLLVENFVLNYQRVSRHG